MQICHNPFLITWGPFENVNLLYFLLKIQIWNGCNVVNIAGNPIKDINVNLSFLSSRWKVVECTPLPEMEKFLTSFLSSGSKDVECTPLELASGGNLGKSTFPCTVQWCMQICHNPFLITWGPFQNVNLLYFLLKIQIWNGCNVVNIAGNPIKDINVNLSFLSSRWKVVECTPLPEMEKFLTSFLSSGSKDVECTPLELASGGNLGKSTFPCTVQWCMQICHNPFLITWGPFENVNLLYFLLKIQIWNGCNVVNIAGNPIKDINVNLSFLSSRWKVVECTPYQKWKNF